MRRVEGLTQWFCVFPVSCVLRVGRYTPSAELKGLFLTPWWDFWWDFNQPSSSRSRILSYMFRCWVQVSVSISLLLVAVRVIASVAFWPILSWWGSYFTVSLLTELFAIIPTSQLAHNIQHYLMLARGWAIPCAKAVLGTFIRRARKDVPRLLFLSEVQDFILEDCAGYIPTEKPYQVHPRVGMGSPWLVDAGGTKSRQSTHSLVSFTLIPWCFVTLGFSASVVLPLLFFSRPLLFCFPLPGMVQMWMSITTFLLGLPATPCGPSLRWWSALCTSALPTTTSSASGCCSRLEPTQILTAAGPSTSKVSLEAPQCVWWMLSWGMAVKQHLSISWLTLEPIWTWWKWKPWELNQREGSKLTLRLCRCSRKQEVSCLDLLKWHWFCLALDSGELFG